MQNRNLIHNVQKFGIISGFLKYVISSVKEKISPLKPPTVYDSFIDQFPSYPVSHQEF